MLPTIRAAPACPSDIFCCAEPICPTALSNQLGLSSSVAVAVDSGVTEGVACSIPILIRYSSLGISE